MDSATLLSLIASISSLVVGISAIWLSITFYKMTIQTSKETDKASRVITSSVERLEKLFDKLYSDTFGIMRDTVSDMRKHIWPEDSNMQRKVDEEAEGRAEEKIAKIRESVDKELSQMLKGQKTTETKLSALREEMQGLVERTISQSRKAESEARQETLREQILKYIYARDEKVVAEKIFKHFEKDFSGGNIFSELREMRDNGVLSWEGDRDGIAYTDVVSLT